MVQTTEIKTKKTGARTTGLLFLAGFGLLIAVVTIQQRVRSATRVDRSPPSAVGVQAPPDAPPAPNRLPAWQRGLSLRETVLEQGRLVQHRPDGTKVRFAVDPDLQQTADRLLRRYEVPYGAIVMLSVRTGRVLAMAGYAARDPRLGPIPLATKAWAPAASVFKLITASALLERNRARPMTKICYHGGLRGLTVENLVDDPKKDKTCHTFADGVGMSLNPVIGKLARKLTRDELLETTNRFGFNARVDADVPVDRSQAEIPRGEFARARVAAGFWHTTLSPLHGAQIAQAIANAGVMVRSRLVERVTTADGQASELPKRWRRQVVTPFVAKVVGRMMVLTTTVGTARDGFYDRRGRAYLPAHKVAAKTGSLRRKNPTLDYNWLVGFAPYDRPQVAFAVLLGNPLRWRTKPHYLARQMLQAYFAQGDEGK